MSPANATTWAPVPTSVVTAARATFPYRELGPRGETPVVFLTHLTAVLDNWDPRLVDAVAATRHVITFDNRGVGAATGTVPTSIEAMAEDAVARSRRWRRYRQGHPGDAPRPRAVGREPPRHQGVPLLHRTPNGRSEATAFVARLSERTADRDKKISVSAFRRQLKAIHGWGTRAPQDLSTVTIPVLVANGDHDRMVPTTNTVDMGHRFPDSRIVIYPDAGHGGVFQYHDRFAAELVAFLSA